ncbi:GGDEF domain-containing protein [Rubrobacter marinus]|nr:GGDEF domain-containing protein [Rubrobacter marinus]
MDGGHGSAHLIVLRGPNLGALHRLEGTEVVVGGDPFRAGVVLNDSRVAPAHARIFPGPGAHYFVEPLAGGPGRTELNGEALIAARPLRDGDRLALGESLLEFSEPDALKAELNESLRRALNEDHLTGLLSKPRFDEEFEGALAAARAREEPLGVIMADVDNLKEINDEHGHLLGEFTVGEVGHILDAVLGEGRRRATRFGGDEYQAILPGEDAPATAALAESVRSAVEEHTFERDGVTVSPTLSVGTAAHPEAGSTTDDLTRAADRALYRAKQAGGNTVSE